MDARIDLTENRDFREENVRITAWGTGERRWSIDQGHQLFNNSLGYVEGENCDRCGKHLHDAFWLRDYNLCLECSKDLSSSRERFPW